MIEYAEERLEQMKHLQNNKITKFLLISFLIS